MKQLIHHVMKSSTVKPIGIDERQTKSETKVDAFQKQLEKTNQDVVAHRQELPLSQSNEYKTSQMEVELKNGQPYRVAYYDEAGTLLTRSSFNAEAILRLTERFGIDRSSLGELADQMDADGVKYKPYELYQGTGSDHGIDLRDLANGGFGTAYDWTQDANVEKKGPGAEERLRQTQAWAAEIGIIKNPEVTTEKGIDPNFFKPLRGGDGILREFVTVSGNTARWHTTESEAKAAIMNSRFATALYNLQEDG